MTHRCPPRTALLRIDCSPAVRAIALVILTLALTVHSAAAGTHWCRSDPVVVIDGQVADVFVSVPLDDLAKVNGPTEIVITTPVQVRATLATPGVGFGYGEKVRFDKSPSLDVTQEGIEVRIKVRVPARDAIPVRVEFSPRVVGVLAPDSAEGTANEWIALRSATEPAKSSKMSRHRRA